MLDARRRIYAGKCQWSVEFFKRNRSVCGIQAPRRAALSIAVLRLSLGVSTDGKPPERHLMATALRRRPTGRSEPSSVSGATQRQAAAAPRRSSFRPRSRSRVRLLAGVALLAAAVVVNLAVYRRLDERVPVLQVTRDVPAGEQIVESDIREVEASTSSDINVVSAAELTSIVGQTAIVRLVAGSLLVRQALSTRPLVSAGSSIVALTFPTGGLPAGLRERSH